MNVKAIMTLTVLAAALALGGCNREGDAQAPSQSSTAPSELSGSGATGSQTTPAEPDGTMGTQTAPGAADQQSGNAADQNTTDAVPTQQQLDPVPSTNEPAGTSSPARP
jgi:hypothetical protein